MDGFKPSFGAGAPPDTPLVYTSGRERTAWRYPQALCDEHWEACGEVVADDTYCLRLCLTCNVNAHERVVKIRRRRGNSQDAYPENAVWATHVTFRAMATAPPEQLAKRQPKQPEAPPFELRGVWASSVSSDDDQRGGVWASPVSSDDDQPGYVKPPARRTPSRTREEGDQPLPSAERHLGAPVSMTQRRSVATTRSGRPTQNLLCKPIN